MFNTEEIFSPIPGRFACKCATPSDKDAEMIVARFLMSVRKTYGFADLYCKGRYVIVDTPLPQATVEIARLLNNSI